MHRLTALVVAAALAGSAAPALAQPVAGGADRLAELFGAEPISSLALSPDGSKVSLIQGADSGATTLQIVDVATGTTRVALALSAESMPLAWCDWSDGNRLLCGLLPLQPGPAGSAAGALLGVDSDGTDAKAVLQPAIPALRYNSIIDWLPDDPGHVLVALPGSIEKLDIRTGNRSVLERMEQVTGALFDGYGTLRVRHVRNVLPPRIQSRWEVRRPDRSRWDPLRITTSLLEIDRFMPVGIGESRDELLVLNMHEGRLAMLSVDLANDFEERVVFARPDVDVVAGHRLGKHNRVVAALYSDHRQRFHFFDERVIAIQQQAARQFPEQEISVVDESWDRRFYLLFVRGEHDAGTYYRFDSATATSARIAPLNATIDGRRLGTTRPAESSLADTPTTVGYLTLPENPAQPLPTVITLLDSPRAPEYWDYDYVSEYLAARGYAVLRGNYRGLIIEERGSAEWSGLGALLNELDATVDSLAATGVVDPSRVCIVGSTFGGALALLAGARRPERYRCVANVGGVTTRAALSAPFLIYSAGGSIMAGGRKPLDQRTAADGGAPLDAGRDISVPVLVMHGANDRNVGVALSQRLVADMKQAGVDVTYLEYEHADERFRPQRDRVHMLATLGRFLDSHLQPTEP